MSVSLADGGEPAVQILSRLMYFLVRCLAQTVIKGFFSEVTIVGRQNIPVYGPVIFVGNHNNQFVDASMLINVIPRRVRFLIADISLQRAVIGTLARIAGCITVKRPQDMIYGGIGFLTWETQSKSVNGLNTRFKLDVRSGDRIKIDHIGTYNVHEVISDSKLTVDDIIELPCADPSVGCTFHVLPKIDQSEVYEKVSDALIAGSSIGIFPEGGSHDRTDLLPLKPGVSIMAMTSALEGAEDVMVVPVGFSYFQGHKVLSRATVEIGKPIWVSSEILAEYKTDRRAAVARLLKNIEDNLRSCIISAADFKVLKDIRLCASLYPPERMKVSKETYHSLCHLFSIIFSEKDESSDLIDLRRDLKDYGAMLKSYGIPDHEVWQLKQSTEGAMFSMAEKALKLIVALLFGGLFSPLWIPLKYCSSFLAEQHRTEALSKSSVKIQGRDVVASYKIIIVLVLLPMLTAATGLLFGLLFQRSFLGIFTSIAIAMIFLPVPLYWSHRLSMRIIPLCRQFRSLFLAIFGKINQWREVEKELITFRMEMQVKVRNVMRKLGPLTSSDFTSELDKMLPSVVMEADTRRLQRNKDDFTPFIGRSYFECREEIL